MLIQKEVFIVGGPNGSGKTTFVKQFLPQYANVMNFVNADDIAVRRRYLRSRSNFWYNYKANADNWYLFDNSGKSPIIAAKSINGRQTILNSKYFDFYITSIGGKDAK